MFVNLVGRVRNTRLRPSEGLLPICEAVVNSIHAIEERDIPLSDGHITVNILRQRDLLTSARTEAPTADERISGFRITDNGIGFTERNMLSFRTLDSDYKLTHGGRGIGRLLWLKAFEAVKVESSYLGEDGKHHRRHFVFSAENGIQDDADTDVVRDTSIRTSVTLEGLRDQYLSSSRMNTGDIAAQLLEHFLWFFIRPSGVPKIDLIDRPESFVLNEMFGTGAHGSPATESISVKGSEFQVTHVRRRSGTGSAHAIAWCADDRLVTRERLSGRIPGLHRSISDEAGDFVYWCYVSSPFLNEKARPERTGFDVAEKVGALFAHTEIGLGDVRDAVCGRIRGHLREHLERNQILARDRVDEFVNKKAPRYRPIVNRMPEREWNLDPTASDKELELILHQEYSGLEREVIAEGHSIMENEAGEPDEEYRGRLSEYMKKAQDLTMADLAHYVSHRRVVIELLEKAIQRDDSGNYKREDVVHELVMPLRKESGELKPGESNLWLLDERLTFHNYLASDKQLTSMPITGSSSRDRPDILVLNIFDRTILTAEEQTAPWASLGVVEFKRPMRGDDKDPIEQAMRYVTQVRAGGMTTARGRPMPGVQKVPGFCYIVADLTPKLLERCTIHDLTETAEADRYCGYKRELALFIEVMSFDHVVRVAKERNRAFFDKLGLPAN